MNVRTRQAISSLFIICHDNNDSMYVIHEAEKYKRAPIGGLLFGSWLLNGARRHVEITTGLPPACRSS
jgi:hypothetical protein